MKKTFYWSLGGHVGLLLVVVLVSLITSCAKKPKIAPHVFTVHSPPSQPVQKIEQKKEVSQPVAKQTPPKKTTTKPKKQTSKPPEKKPKPTPKKDPPKTVSWEEFARENDIPAQQQPPPSRPQTQPQRNPMDDIRKELSMLMKNSPDQMRNSSQQDIEALHGYVGSLRNRLNLLWNQPTNLPPGEWVAHVEFTVSGTGKITNVRFVKRSGNTSFDQSLIRALNQFLQANPPPDRKTHTFEIPFRMLVR